MSTLFEYRYLILYIAFCAGITYIAHHPSFERCLNRSEQNLWGQRLAGHNVADMTHCRRYGFRQGEHARRGTQ